MISHTFHEFKYGTMVGDSSSVRVIACLNPNQVPPLLMHMTGCAASHQEFGMYSTTGGSQGMYITFACAKKKTKTNKAEPTLALNPRGDVTTNPKQG